MPTKNDMQTRLGQWIAIIFLAGGLVAGAVQAIGGLVHLMSTRLVVDEVGLWQGAGGLRRERADTVLEATHGQLTFEQATLQERLVAVTPDILIGVTVAVVAWLLLGVVRRTQEGDPFTKANADALTRAAVVAVVGGSLWMLADVVSDGYLVDQAPFELPATFTTSFAPIAVAGILLVVAGVFRRGIELREETEGLV